MAGDDPADHCTHQWIQLMSCKHGKTLMARGPWGLSAVLFMETWSAKAIANGWKEEFDNTAQYFRFRDHISKHGLLQYKDPYADMNIWDVL